MKLLVTDFGVVCHHRLAAAENNAATKAPGDEKTPSCDPLVGT
jgi:hypothetical protein